MRAKRVARSLGLLGVGLGVVSCGVDSERELAQKTQAVVVCQGPVTLPGIDVSAWQATINWDSVAGDGVKFAFIRVSDGLNSPDSRFATNWAEARRVGIKRGVYQFFRPGQDAIAQADLLLSRMGELAPDDLSPVIDVEAADGQPPEVLRAKIAQWIQRVQSATGRKPIIYSGKYFWPSSVNSSEYVDYSLWIPQYGPVCPDLPAPWTSWDFFQYSATGSVSGISGNVDMDTFNGDMARLLSVAGGTPLCGDTYCTSGEDHGNCPADCPICELVPAEGRVVEESEICFTKGGPLQYLRDVDGAGSGGHLIWTHTTDLTGPANYGIWNLTFAEAGLYRLEAYMDSAWAESTGARYLVTHAGSTDTVALDQSTAGGWRALGDFDFVAGTVQTVRLNDNTGEPVSADVQLVFDGLRLTRLDAVRPTDGGDVVDAVSPPTDVVGDTRADDVQGADATAGTDAGVGTDVVSAREAGVDSGHGPGVLRGGCSVEGAKGTKGKSVPKGLVWCVGSVLAMGTVRGRRRKG